MPPVTAAVSPFRCRWIRRGSETRLSNWSLALCDRVHEQPRVVTEDECACCELWAAAESDELSLDWHTHVH